MTAVSTTRMKHANKRVLTSDWLAERIEREESFIDDPVRQCAELELCRDDPVHFINNWGWTYDPRNIFRGLPVNIPFILYPRQAELLRWFHERVMAQEDCQIEKSREEGVTWLISVAYGVWGFTFHDGFAVGVGSRKLILVDRKDDMSAIFPKSLFMINRLPPWMKPKIAPAFCNIRNLDNGSTITGEAGDEIGRGGRTTFTVIDEAAFVQHPIISDTALLGVGSPICWMSTPNGSNNPFAQRHRAGATNTFRIHFRDNPFKDAAWEAETRAKMSPAMFAQEHDISFTASIERVVIPSDWVTAAINLDLTATSQVVAGLDIGDSGMDMNVLVFRRGGKIIDLVAWDGDGNPNNTAHRAIQECTSRNVKILHYDRVGVGASVAGPLMSAERLSFRFIPVLGGARPTDTRYADALDITGADRFRNYRAEMWWALRMRFLRTFEYVTKGVEHPHNELISIPDNGELITQLSQPTYSYTETGLIKIQSKDEMRAAGGKSPDHADATVYAYIPAGNSSGELVTFGEQRVMS